MIYDLREYINESVKKTFQESITRQHIRNIVAEQVRKYINEESNEENSDMKRNAVMKALKDPKYKHAQLAYDLWPDMGKDTARSLFAKMANGTPDNDGVVRNFNDPDINKLYQIIRKR